MPIGSPQWMYASGEDYTLDQSLKFDNAADAYLSKTPTSAGNRRTWTFSAWLKIGTPNTWTSIFSAGANGSNMTRIRIDDNGGRIFFDSEVSGSTQQRFYTSAFYRDTSAWYHFVLAVDTTQGTASNRVKMYVNGSQVTAFAQSDYPSQNYDYHINNTQVHYVGRQVGDTNGDWNGYMAEVNFIDGQALTPADFGETGDYGEWKPIEYEGTYGTNGFYLNFAGGGVMSATGGNSTATDGDYKVASFTSNGTFTPSADGYVEYLVIGGGGAGAADGATTAGNGGGGAGGYRTGMLSVTASTAYSITIGAGGSGALSANQISGSDSVFSSITSAGGGGGGWYTSTPGAAGGSGGGGAPPSASGGAGTSGQGKNGEAGSSNQGGGGGGAAEAGGTDGTGQGGDGLASSITGSSVTRAGGGGGSRASGGARAGGTGGGGAGGNGGAGTSGTANTGSGGGGGVSGGASGSGGSGIVIIRYKFQ